MIRIFLMKNFNQKNLKFTKKEFKNAIQSAHKSYSSWENKLHCPFFKGDIYITRSGWQHIMTEQRPKHQKFWRAKYFNYIPQIIAKTTTVQKETVCFSNAGKIHIWSFVSIEKGNILEVVIRQIGKQPKHFYSFVYKGIAPTVIKAS